MKENLKTETPSATLSEQDGTFSTVPVKKKFTRYQVFIIVLIALLQFTVILDFMILSPLGDILMKTMGLTTTQFASVVAAYAISAGISGFLAAGFADKFDRKKLLLFFYGGFVIGTAFCGLASTYESLFIARIVTGIFGGVISSISMAIITDLFDLQQRGRVMGFVQMAFAASQVLGVPLGLRLASTWNWHVTFYSIVGLSLAIGIMVVGFMRPITQHLKLQHDRNALQHLIQTIKRKEYRMGFIAIALLSMGGFLLMPFTSPFLVNNVHIAQNRLDRIFVFTGLASVIIMPIIGKLSDSIDKFKLFTIGSLIACVMIVVYTNLVPVPEWAVILINMVLFMGIMSRMVPATALNSAVPDLKDRGAYMSVSSSLQQLAGGLAAIFAGFVVKKASDTAPLENFDVLGYIMVALMFWCIYLVYRVSQLIKSRQIKTR